MAWKLLDSRLHLSNRWLTLRENHYELPSGKQLPSYWVMEKPSYVLVVGESPKGLLLVREFRPGSGKMHLSFPAGFIDEGETPEQAALREFREETGYNGRHPRVLGKFDALAAWLHSTCTVVYLEADAEPATYEVDGEIEGVEVGTWDETLAQVRSGAISDMHSVAGFYLARDLLDKS
ncbi:MAG TPA: NUDIX hydrolase [Bryobacteraceae bacterium]|nr:NUDIX hydrolase [Bryobacteraceae bacterium]